ncbi:hypothetical protein FRC08_004113 [Ceratobasidium sp. 394]|nr:hypothetical protein FRC08_004113 [Ceratobasidium sp. 394]KAG9101588.1 hypothetical protein FS749_005468 [Ceratobasidium sp. UAMH 11750]
MGHLFMIVRLGLFALVFAGAGVVLGICANLATHFLPTGIHDFLLFSLVVSALTIVVFILLALRSQPRIDAVVLFILVALWLTMGAYSQDVIGHQFCYALKGQTIPAKNDTTFSAENYCRQMKTVLAFSWANFVFLVLALIGLLTVVFKLYARGERDIWKDSMSDVELFQEKELPKPEVPVVYPPPPPASNSGSGSGRGGHTFVYYPGSHSAPLQHQVIQQQPGHSVIIQNGQVTQVPGSVTSV